MAINKETSSKFFFIISIDPINLMSHVEDYPHAQRHVMLHLRSNQPPKDQHPCCYKIICLRPDERVTW